MKAPIFIRKLTWLWSDTKPLRRLFAYGTFAVALFLNLVRHRRPNQDLWLIGEARGSCQPDNGYYFFRYCRLKHPEAPVFLVLHSSCTFYHELSGDSHVIAYGSRTHMYAFVRATICFYTHTVSDLIYRELFPIVNKGKKLVFLHHGTLGFKKFNVRYERSRNAMDLFTTGCDFERDILVNEVGVDEDRVAVTGYARYDAMNCAERSHIRQIAYMPTHRDWLRGSDDMLVTSTFLKRVTAVLNAPSLQVLLARTGFTLKLKLHPAYSRFIAPLVVSCDQMSMVGPGDEPPLELLRDSCVLVTDYSSVALDFLQLGKPVLFYRFDIDRYRAGRGSYIDLDDPAYGHIFYDLDALIAGLARVIEDGCKLDAAMERTRQRLARHADGHCCERIYARARSLTASR